MRALAIFAGLAALALAGCSGPPGASSAAGGPGAPATCERTCNSGYDSCMDRFAGIGGLGSGTGGVNDPSRALGPNDVCPEQLKSCLRSCLN